MAEKNPNWDKRLQKWPASITIQRYIDEGHVIPEDIKLIQKHIDNKKAKSHLSFQKEENTKRILCYWRKYIRTPYSQVTIDDIESGVAAIKAGKTQKGKPFKKNTLHSYIADLKSFIVFLNRKKILRWSADDMESLREIKTPGVDQNVHKSRDMLKPEEILLILSKMSNPMHLALIATLYESGGRPEEVSSLTWQDIQKDEYGYRCWLTGYKTEEEENNENLRVARLTMSAPYLSAWHRLTPKPADTEYIFVGRRDEPLSTSAAATIFYRAAKDALPNRKVTLYRLRKSRATELFKLGGDDTAKCLSLWGNVNSRMKKIYVKYSADDIDRALLAAQGIDVKDDKKADESPLKAKICMFCNEKENPPTADFCLRCGRPLSNKAKEEVQVEVEQSKKDIADVDMDKLFENPKFKARILELIAGKA